MAEKSVLARIREFLDSLGSDGDEGTHGNEPISEAQADADEASEYADAPKADIRADDAPTDDAENLPDDGTGGSSDDAGAADDATDDGEKTMPDSEAELAQLRDSMTVIATENERLRTILTDNGIDFEGEPEIEAAIDKTDAEDVPDAEYDDEAAQADIDAVKARNAKWDK